MPERIRIGHVTQSGGGVETSILTILAHLDRATFAHTVICPAASSLATRARELSADVVPVVMVRPVRPWIDLRSLISVVRAVKAAGVDVIHAHSGKGGVLGRLAGALTGLPVVFTPQAFSYLVGRGLQRRFLLLTERLLARLPGLLVASSQSEADRAIRDVGWPASRVRSDCPNAIASSGFLRQPRQPGPLCVITAARLMPQKDPLRLVRVAARVAERDQNVRFAVIGSGYSDELGAEVADAIVAAGLEDRMSLLPWSDARTVRAHFEAADVYLSTSRYEGLPFALLEALDAGLPVVATAVDGNRDVVCDGVNGYLAETDDELVAGVLRLAADAGLRLEMGRAGAALLRERFSVDRTMPVLGDIYRQLASGPARHEPNDVADC